MSEHQNQKNNILNDDTYLYSMSKYIKFSLPNIYDPLKTQILDFIRFHISRLMNNDEAWTSKYDDKKIKESYILFLGAETGGF